MEIANLDKRYVNLKDEELQKLNETPQNYDEYDAKSNPSLDDVLENAGYNSFTYKVIAIQILIIIVDGIHMTMFSSLIIPLKNLFQISEFGFEIVSSILFVGVALGSFTTGFLSNRWSRPFLINFFMTILLICMIILAFSLNVLFFGLFRFLIGIFLGLTLPISINLCAECLPMKNRALVLTGIWTGFSLGVILSLLIMLFAMPNFETNALTSTILYISIIPSIILIITMILLEDSPRNLILRNRDEEAFKILEKITGKTLEKSEKISIVRSVKDGVNNELSKEFKEIFNSRYLRVSLILTFIWALNSINIYGPTLISNFTLKSLGQEKKNTNHQIIIDQIIINFIELPSQIIGGLLCEIKILGRTWSSNITSFLAIVCTLIFIFIPNTYTVLFAFSQAFLSMVFNIISAYSCEVYPTKIRDYALGYMYSSTRIGGIISQFLFLYLNSIGIWVPYYASIGFIVTNILLILFLPYETLGKPLDTDHEKQ